MRTFTLSYCSCCCHVECCRDLSGDALFLPPQRSHTPLHTAVENGFADVVEVLLVAGANIEAREKVRRLSAIW